MERVEWTTPQSAQRRWQEPNIPAVCRDLKGVGPLGFHSSLMKRSARSSEASQQIYCWERKGQLKSYFTFSSFTVAAAWCCLCCSGRGCPCRCCAA